MFKGILLELGWFSYWEEFLVMLKRFIDEDFEIWLSPTVILDKEANAKWIDFQAGLGDDHGLEWEIEDISNSGVFLDLRLTIHQDRSIKTALY